MGKVTNPMTMIASVEIAQKLRVAIKAGTTTAPPEVAIAGVGDPGVGVNDYLVAINEKAAIEPYNKSGTLEMVANGVVGIGADVFPAAGGKISTVPAGDPLGMALEAATADGDIIEILVYPKSMSVIQSSGVTSIATTGATSEYIIAPKAGRLAEVDFSSLAAFAANDTNYITWTITNLGQDGAGTAVMLLASDVNTTKATGGSALVANTRRQLSLTATPADLVVAEGDRIKITATATGTLAGAVTVPVYSLRFV
jgi:hypothetical protein